MASWKSFIFILTDTKRRHCARFKLRQTLKKKWKWEPFPFPTKYKHDSGFHYEGSQHGSRHLAQVREQNRRFSCLLFTGRKETIEQQYFNKRPFARVCGQWLKQMKRLLKAGKTCNRAGPLLALASRATFHCLLPLRAGGRGLVVGALRASWSPPTMKAAEAGGPLTGNEYQRSYLTSVTIINRPNNKVLFPFHSV